MVNIIIGAIALGLLWAIMTLGVHLTYRILDVADLSVEGTLTTGGATAAILIYNGVNPWVGCFAALGAGLAGGFVSGILHTKLKIPALLSGILTMTACYSVNLRIMGRANIPLPSTGSSKVVTVFTPVHEYLKNTFAGNDILASKNFSALVVGLAVVVLLSVIVYWFFGTEFGSAIRATGNNQNMVRAQGISTSVMIIVCLMISNALVAFSGALIAQYQAYADIQMGTGSIVIGLASLIIGEVLIGTKTFKRNLFAIVVGAVAYRIIIALVMTAGMEANDLKLFTAVTVAICLSMPLVKDKINGIIKKRNGDESITNND